VALGTAASTATAILLPQLGASLFGLAQLPVLRLPQKVIPAVEMVHGGVVEG
jgi:hypothetical protein